MPRLNTPTRNRKSENSDKATKNLIDKGWTTDSLWWYSPYSGLRFLRQDAVAVEELRAWGASDSAFLNDHDHSMWSMARDRENALVNMDDLSGMAIKRDALKKLASLSNKC